MDTPQITELTEQNTQQASQIGRLERQIRQMALVNKIAEAANNTSNPQDALHSALNQICQDTGWPIGHAFVTEKHEQHIRLIPLGVWHLEEPERFKQFIDLSESLRFEPGSGLPGIVYDDAEALWAQSIKSDAERFALGEQLGLQSAFGFPILIGDEVVAILEFFSKDNIAPDELVLDTVSQLGMLLGRVFERRRASDEKETLTERLVKTSRQAGMAEVASGVLHNVGNVLNSITVSVTLIMERAEQSNISGVEKIAGLLNEHTDDLATFLSQDDKGSKVIEYINQLAKQLKYEQESNSKELESLVEHVDHIKSIVRRQQHYAKTTSVDEQVNIKNLLEDALKMNGLNQSNRYITIERSYADIPEFATDKHNVIQIINNLVGNAKQALEGTDNDNKTITIRTQITEDKRVKLDVQDNGCGIPKEKQRSIFQFGFTTKESGHGFGLHSSANTAKSMGGALTFHSDGENKGTTFTLELPFKDAGQASGRKEIAA